MPASVSSLTMLANLRMEDCRPLGRIAYYRAGTGSPQYDITDRLLLPVIVTRPLNAFATAEISLDNADGLLNPKNLVSSFNWTSSAWDPLIDDHRIVDIQMGARCRINVASGATVNTVTVPQSGTAGQLTDRIFGANSVADTPWVGWGNVGQITIRLDLGTQRAIRGVAFRGQTDVASAHNIHLPDSVQIALSIGSAAGPYTTWAGPGMAIYRDSHGPMAYDITHDLVRDCQARWVEFRLFTQSARQYQVDEVEVYAADQSLSDYDTMFSGRLGDSMEVADDKIIHLEQIRDRMRRMDDLFLEITRKYHDTDISSIVFDLYVNSTKGAGVSTTQMAVDVASFNMPWWKAQNQSVYKSACELARMIAWEHGWDPMQGKILFRWLRDDLTVGERVLETGRGPWREFTLNASGRDLRNKVKIKYGENLEWSIPAMCDSDSIARYGERYFIIQDPAIPSAQVAVALANAVLQDYGSVALEGTISGDGDGYLHPGQVVSVVDSDTSMAATTLFRITQLEHRLEEKQEGAKDWTTSLRLRGIRPRFVSVVSSIRARANSGFVEMDWGAPNQVYWKNFGCYVSRSSTSIGSLFLSTDVFSGTCSPLTNGLEYWLTVRAADQDDAAGKSAGPINVTPALGGPQAWRYGATAWQPTVTSISPVGVTRNRARQLRITSPMKMLGQWTSFHVYRSSPSTTTPDVVVTFLAATHRFPPDWNWLTFLWTDYLEDPGTYYYRVAAFAPRNNMESDPSNWIVTTAV